MPPKKIRLLSVAMAAVLVFTGATAAAIANTGHAPTRAALAANMASSPPVNLDNCPTLAEGYHGGCVNQLQTELNAIMGLNLSVDGTFASATYDAVRAFQQKNGINPDGIVGPATNQALDTGWSSVPTPTPKPLPQPPDAVDSRYQSLGGSTSFLGSPISPVFSLNNDGIGRHYQGGSIYWSSATGAREVHGAIRDLWGSTGRERRCGGRAE